MTFPWIEAALTGGLLGLAGASLFIAVSWFIQHLAEERRHRAVFRLMLPPESTASPTVNPREEENQFTDSAIRPGAQTVR